MPLRLKIEYQDVVIGFNNSSLPLGKRNDLHLLIEFSRAHNRTDYLAMFGEIPDEKEVLEIKATAFVKKQAEKKGKRK